MNVLAARRKVLSGIVVALVLLALIVPAVMAATPPPLNLPAGSITAAYGTYLGGTLGAFDITFSGIPAGSFDVANGVPYAGWCLEDGHLNNSASVTLYSSYAPTPPMPLNLATYQDTNIPIVAASTNPPNVGDSIPWDKLNYLLNNPPGGATANDVIRNTQAAVKLLIYGKNTNPVLDATNLSLANTAVTNANTNGGGFVPAPGQTIGVLLYFDGIDSVESNSTTNNLQEVVIELTVSPFYDRGDLPDPTYPTLISSNGPSHLVGPNLFLGQCVDADSNGQPDTPATGDNIGVGAPGFGNVNPPPAGPGYGTCAEAGNDEDGVARNMSDKWTPGAAVRLNVTVQGSGEMACWIDWNNSGNLGDNSNKFISIGPVSTGSTEVNVTVPSTGYTVGNPLYVRCRLFPTGGAPGGALSQDDFVGSAPGGEVEDYRWSFGPNAVTLSGMTASSAASPLALPLGLVTVLGVLLGGIVLARRPV